MKDERTITVRANEILAELRASPDSDIERVDFKRGYLRALEWVIEDTGIKQGHSR